MHISFKAVAVGLALDIFAFVSFPLVIGLMLAANFPANGNPEPLRSLETPGQLLSYIYFALIFLLVGYVVAKIAKQSQTLNAGIVGAVFTIGFGFVQIKVSLSLVDALGFAAAFLLHLGGGYLAHRVTQNRVIVRPS